MLHVWTQLLAGQTMYPMFVLTGPGISALPSPLIQWEVGISQLKVKRSQSHYRHMLTKIEAWRLPCKMVAYLDADAFAIRSPDRIFDRCNRSQFCAVQDQGIADQSYFNAGVLVLRPSYHEYKRIRSFVNRVFINEFSEQGVLNRAYANHWKRLPIRYNRMHLANGGLYKQNDIIIHEKLDSMPIHLHHTLLSRIHPPNISTPRYNSQLLPARR